MSTVQFITSIFGEIWRFMTGFTLPIIDTTPAGLLIGVFLASFSIEIIRKATGFKAKEK